MYPMQTKATGAMGGNWFESNVFLVFDLETTGVDVAGDRPVSYALMAMASGSCVLESYSIVDPGVDVPGEAAAIHGISTEMARTFGMDLEHALGAITDALLRATREGWYVVGMNVGFDLTIVDARCREAYGVGLAELGFAAPVLDALVLDRHYDRFRSGKRTLERLAEVYGVQAGNYHDALEDCRVTYRVLEAIVNRYPEITGIEKTKVTETLGAYHRDWLESYRQWATQRGREVKEFDGWPISVS